MKIFWQQLPPYINWETRLYLNGLFSQVVVQAVHLSLHWLIFAVMWEIKRPLKKWHSSAVPSRSQRKGHSDKCKWAVSTQSPLCPLAPVRLWHWGSSLYPSCERKKSALRLHV